MIQLSNMILLNLKMMELHHYASMMKCMRASEANYIN